jgi:DNA repair ATPase RecN
MAELGDNKFFKEGDPNVNNVDGGKFSKEGQKTDEAKKEERQDATQFITDEPSIIKTEDVFAMLGEQIVRVANWKKISLSWQNQYKILRSGTIQLKTKYEELVAVNKQLTDSNAKYVEINKKLDNRVTELNRALEELNKVAKKFENDYIQLNSRFEGVISHNNKLSKTIEEYDIKINDKDSELKKLENKLAQLKEKNTEKLRKKASR